MSEENTKDIMATAHVTKEFTLIDPLSDGECHALLATSEADNVSIQISQSRRIILFACDDLRTATGILAEVNLIESIGVIREITEWDIVGLSEQYPFDITIERNDN